MVSSSQGLWGVQSRMLRRHSGTRTWGLFSAGLERMCSMLNGRGFFRPLLAASAPGTGSADILGRQAAQLGALLSLHWLPSGVLLGKGQLLKWTGKAIQNHGFVLAFQVTVILAAEFLFYTHTYSFPPSDLAVL